MVKKLILGGAINQDVFFLATLKYTHGKYLINALFQIMVSVPNLMNVSVYPAGKEIYVINAHPIQDALKAQYIY